jgi:hypothetical protein
MLASLIRKESYWLLIPEQLEVQLLAIRTVRRFTIWHLTSSAVVQVLPQTAIMSQVKRKRSLTKNIVEMIKRQLELHRLNTHTENRV